MFLKGAKERLEASGWRVEVWTSPTAGEYFDVEATRDGETHVVRCDYAGVDSDEAADRRAAEAVRELARMCGVDVSDL